MSQPEKPKIEEKITALSLNELFTPNSQTPYPELRKAV